MSGVNHDQLEALQKKLDQLQQSEKNKFYEDCSKELAARLLALVIPRTPVGVYPPETGKEGGTLRRGWTGGKQQGAKAYADSLPVIHAGDYYVIAVKNPVEYASYVEYGHRQSPGRYVPAIKKQLVQAWVTGQFFLRISTQELEAQQPAILSQKLYKFLEDTF